MILKPNQFSSVAQSCLTLCDSTDCSTPGFPVHHQLLELAQTHVHLILCCPLLLPSIFPSIKVFPNESVLHIRWPECWSCSFSISLSNEYSGLVSFRIDWFDLAVQWTLKSLLQRIFLIQGSNPCFLHCRHILYCLSHQGSSSFL